MIKKKYLVCRAVKCEGQARFLTFIPIKNNKNQNRST
jgi:hypothetical protein